MVTVSSAQESPPKSIFALSQCSAGSDGLITVGCLTRGFSPADSLTFNWKDGNGKKLTDVVQYPALGRDGDYTKISHLRVKKSDWDSQKPYICEASNSKGTIDTKVAPPVIPPTLSLVPVITETSTFAMCVIENFYPKNLSVQWKVKDKNQSETKLEYKRNAEGLYTAHSLYYVSSDIWNTNADYTCEATHQGKLFPVTKNFKAKLTLALKPPFMKKLFVSNTIVLEAVVSGDVQKTVENTAMSCKNVLNTSDERAEFSKDISQYTKKYNVTIDTKKWFEGEMVTCTISDPNNNKGIEQNIRFNIGDGQTPSVFIYKQLDYKSTDNVSLVCEVNSPKLGDVYMMWNVSGGKEPYREGRTSAPILRENSMSVLSILTMPKRQYEDHQTTIICAVMHANMKNINSPLQVSTSSNEPPEPEKGFALNCNKDVLEEDEFRSLWSTATSFIFLFLFSLTYSAILSLLKMKQ